MHEIQIRPEVEADADAISRVTTDAFAGHPFSDQSEARIVRLGDPAYYRRFGFELGSDLVYPGGPPDQFMAQSFDGARPFGRVEYHSAFAGGG